VDSNGNKDHLGNFGPTLKSTLHGTNSTGSFQFHFSGESSLVLLAGLQGNECCGLQQGQG
jgi:hypothetical protein